MHRGRGTRYQVTERAVQDLAADRTPQICQSQSVNIFLYDHETETVRSPYVRERGERLTGAAVPFTPLTRRVVNNQGPLVIDDVDEFVASLGVDLQAQVGERPRSRHRRSEELDAALIFAPAGELVPAALRAVAKGGTVVCAGIHMSEIPAFSYDLLWGERTLRSVANLTRRDGEEFLALAARVPVRTRVETFPLAQANEALAKLRGGNVRGALVLVP